MKTTMMHIGVLTLTLLAGQVMAAVSQEEAAKLGTTPVSYTHLTLPTILLV